MDYLSKPDAVINSDIFQVTLWTIYRSKTLLWTDIFFAACAILYRSQTMSWKEEKEERSNIALIAVGGLCDEADGAINWQLVWPLFAPAVWAVWWRAYCGVINCDWPADREHEPHWLTPVINGRSTAKVISDPDPNRQTTRKSLSHCSALPFTSSSSGNDHRPQSWPLPSFFSACWVILSFP